MLSTAPWLDTTSNECSAQIRVLAINALGTISDHDALLAQIARDDPDVVFVSELAPSLKDRLAARFSHHVWFSDAPGDGIFTKYPVSSARYFHSPGDRTQLDAVLSTEIGPVRNLGVHTPPPYSVASYTRDRAVG